MKLAHSSPYGNQQLIKGDANNYLIGTLCFTDVKKVLLIIIVLRSSKGK